MGLFEVYTPYTNTYLGVFFLMSDPAAEQLKMYIGGMGGTGKTHVLNALTAYFKEQGESRRLIVVAPTGSAAALVKGSTYHFMFGINECHSDNISRKTLAEFKERLEGVDYVFLDEVSMLSCVDMYHISARLAMCLNRPELLFGGMNVIFAGDFTQLPPAIGAEHASLYSPNEGLFATSKKAQEMAMGKAIWHQVTTVVILRQNMRQRSQTTQDERLRTALANMRYKSCTKADIAFLNSRVSGRPTAPKIADKQFRDVSIITGLNIHKDELNRLASARFAQESGRSLVTFYSEDQLSSSELSQRMRPGQGKKLTCTDISQNLQDILWAAAPSENDKHIPPTLALCVGMPVMIRVNSATELCIMKGQEATVHSWRDTVGTRGQRVLDVLFVTLMNPPTEVRIPGLPINVVPLLRTPITITCSLLDDTTICISRSQVEILHNFAMTDYSSQGKTRPFNPVDLNNCRSHQSYYTALSRTATTEGTLILPSLQGPKNSPVDASKIQGGCSGYLRQEFRELETLDDITAQVYDGSIPVTVQGDTRYTLIESFREHMGPWYVPARMDKALMWSEVEPFESVDATVDVSEWPKTLITHKPKVCGNKTPVAIGASVPVTSKRVFTPMKPSEKRKGRTSETFDLKQSNVDKCITVRKPESDSGYTPVQSHPVAHPYRPAGCRWSNNSCTFDATIFVLFNVWHAAPPEYKDALANFDNLWIRVMITSFKKFVDGLYTLEEVRDYLRRGLHREFPNLFVFGVNTSAEAVLMKWCRGPGTFATISYTCDHGHVEVQSTKETCVIEPGGSRRGTLQQFLDMCKERPISPSVSSCTASGSAVMESYRYMYTPPMLGVSVAFMETPPDDTLRIVVDNTVVVYHLAGIVYYGNCHFTARFVDFDGNVWFNDGMIHARSANREGTVDTVDLMRDATGKTRDHFVYRRV